MKHIGGLIVLAICIGGASPALADNVTIMPLCDVHGEVLGIEGEKIQVSVVEAKSSQEQPEYLEVDETDCEFEEYPVVISYDTCDADISNVTIGSEIDLKTQIVFGGGGGPLMPGETPEPMFEKKCIKGVMPANGKEKK